MVILQQFMSFTQQFPGGAVQYHFDQPFSSISEEYNGSNIVFLVDEHVLAAHPALFQDKKTIAVPSGEEYKTLKGLEMLAGELISQETHRKTMLVGVGGGLTTDIVGFLAAVYMRGLSFGFVPTSVLGMVDAAVGGKNGINLGHHKNMLGTIVQPQFIWYDTSFLASLPRKEWSNGFAEIIKYGFIVNEGILNDLEGYELRTFRKAGRPFNTLIKTCVTEKNDIVAADEKETGLRKILNFGHTAGHAFETLYSLPHGYAVALGMQVACIISEEVTGLAPEARKRLTTICHKYGLPVKLSFNPKQVLDLLKMDKKRNDDDIDYILLEAPGKAVVHKLSFDQIYKALLQFNNEGYR